MLTQKLLRFWPLSKNHRFISHSSRLFDSKNTDSTGKSTASTSIKNNTSEETMIKNVYIPDNFDKWILTWVKKYPKGQVPDRIPAEVIIQAKSRARIKAANYMMVFALLMCITTVISVKQDVKKGDSIQRRNEEWHKKINEEYQAKLKAESSSKS